MEQLWDKLNFVQTFLFRNRFLFLLFSFSDGLTVIRECYCTKPAILQITVHCDLTRPSLTGVKERDCQLFQVCQLTFAV